MFGVTARTATVSARSPARTVRAPRDIDPAICRPGVAVHVVNRSTGTGLPKARIGRSAGPTWTWDSCAGSRYSTGNFLRTTSRIVSVTAVAPMPAAREMMAMAAATGYSTKSWR